MRCSTSWPLPYRPITSAALTLGLFFYGLYCLLEARYRDLTPGR